MGKFLSILAGLLLVLTACGGGGKLTEGNFEDAKFETNAQFKNEGWYKVDYTPDRSVVAINSDNYYVIDGVPVGLSFWSVQNADTQSNSFAALFLTDASATTTPRNPIFDEEMTSIEYIIDGESHKIINLTPTGESVVRLLDGDECLKLLSQMLNAKEVKFVVSTKDHKDLTFNFSPYLEIDK